MLISVDMLARGYDQTDIEHVILARPLKKSFSQHVQTVGRGARSHDGKNMCVVQDHTNNWLRFLNDWNDLYNNGVQELASEADKKPRKEPSDKEKKASECPRCKCLWGNADICPHCGLVRQRKNDAIAVAGEMLELTCTTNQEKYSSEYKEQWYQGLIMYLRSRGKNENRAYHLYKEKFGVAPAWKKIPGDSYSLAGNDAVKYLQRANIAFAKQRAA